MIIKPYAINTNGIWLYSQDEIEYEYGNYLVRDFIKYIPDEVAIFEIGRKHLYPEIVKDIVAQWKEKSDEERWSGKAKWKFSFWDENKIELWNEQIRVIEYKDE